MSSYILHELLDEGGMGEVYAGVELLPSGSSWPIACKVMHSDARDRDELAHLFRMEAETNRRISEGHEGLVNFYHWVRDQSLRDFMIMELVPGCNLSELCTGGRRLTFDVIRLIARDILDVLAYVHGQDIVHCDVSPSNVLISRQGRVKLLDFGLAQSPGLVPDSEKQQERARGEFRGKLPYVSPEVVRGLGADARSDLYSFGSMLYELLTGAPPFGADISAAELLDRIEDWSVPELPEEIPDALRAVTMGFLRYKPEERIPATAAEARDMLHHPVEPERSRAALTSHVEAVYERAPDARAKTRHRGRLAGVRIKGLFVTDGLVEPFPEKPHTVATGRRRSLWRHGAMSLVGIVALAALVLAAYNLHRGSERSPATPVVVTPKDAATAMSETRPEVTVTVPSESAARAGHATAVAEPQTVPTRSDGPREVAWPSKSHAGPRRRPEERAAATPAAQMEPLTPQIGPYEWY